MPDTVDNAGLDAGYLAVLRLYMLRVLLRCNGLRSLFHHNRVQDVRIAHKACDLNSGQQSRPIGFLAGAR